MKSVYFKHFNIHITLLPYMLYNQCECLFVQMGDQIFLGSSAVFFTPQCPFSIQFEI